MTKTEIVVLVLIGLLSSVAYGQDKDKRCKAMADWAVELFNEHRAGVIINVMPQDEEFLKLVKEYKGTADELRKEVISGCSGTRV